MEAHALQELGEYASDGPEVDTCAVEARAIEQLGRPVPARHHEASEKHVAYGKFARQAEVRDLQLAAHVHQQVVRLHVLPQKALAIVIEVAVVVAVAFNITKAAVQYYEATE